MTQPAAWLIAEPALLRAPPAAVLAADLCACLLDSASCRAACEIQDQDQIPEAAKRSQSALVALNLRRAGRPAVRLRFS